MKINLILTSVAKATNNLGCASGVMLDAGGKAVAGAPVMLTAPRDLVDLVAQLDPEVPYEVTFTPKPRK